ncbi:hypothetical protein GGS20DRAFT_275836 [Poronia punctata]|nr:hypothetical protein GGS20DRAFT_275836 [Poronia punctata]
MKSDIAYEPLPGGRPPTKKWNTLSFTVGCTTSLVIGIVFLFIHSAVSTPKTTEEIEAEDWNYCGRSSEAARERGCVMEPMFYGWMPAKCVFRELTDSLPVFEDRTYYRDLNMTEKLRPEQLWAGEYNIVYTPKYHDEHCLFQWRKLQYAMTNRMDFVDNKTMSMHHTTHCADQLSESCEPETGGRATIEIGFYRCRKTIW